MTLRPERATAAWLALLLFGIYLLSFSGRIYSSDGLSMFAVTESWVKRGELSTDQMWTLFGTKSDAAPDGEVYSKYGYGTSLIAAPLYALALFFPFFGLTQFTLLASAIAVALTGGLLYLTARRLGYSPGVGVVAVLLFGLATPAWVYAKEFWSESFSLPVLMAAFYFSLCSRQERHTRDALLAGAALGLAIAVRTTNAVLVPVFMVYGFGATAFLGPILLSLLSVAAYNLVRFGNPLTTGYRPDETFSNPILLGAYGLLFSPGKGLLVYCPFLAALPFGVWQFYRRARRELALFLAIVILYLLLFSAWYYWWGGTSWGPRFLVPTLPFLVLLCAPLLETFSLLDSRFSIAQSLRSRLSAPRAPLALALLFSLLVLLSIINELAGVSISSLNYRLSILNLSPSPDADAIFAPAFSPLLRTWQILKPTNLELAWVRPTPDAVQIDWLVVLPMLALIAFGAIMLVRALRGGATGRALWLGFLLTCVVAGFSLARYGEHPQPGVDRGYAALLNRLAVQERAGDVVILNDDARARLWFDANRARAKWYGLSRDPARWDAPTQALVARVTRSDSRTWFAYDDATADVPNPLRDWMAANLATVQQEDFEGGVHLRLFQAR